MLSLSPRRKSASPQIMRRCRLGSSADIGNALPIVRFALEKPDIEASPLAVREGIQVFKNKA
jgi:hypothetical protein